MSTPATDVPTNGNGEHAEPEQAQGAQPEQPKAEATKEPPKEDGPKRAPMGFGKAGVILTSLNELWQLAKIIYQSGLAPHGLDSVEKITVAIQFGAEFGVAPMASVRSVAVINGTPGWKGDMALALVRSSGLLDKYKKWHEGEGMTRKAFVLTKRRDDAEPMVTSFSVDEAVLAGLWGRTTRKGEPTPWVSYPDRMLYYRALGFNLRDHFPEVMMGTVTAEELGDYPVIDIQATSSSSAPSQRALAAAPPPDPLLASIGVVQATKAADPVMASVKEKAAAAGRDLSYLDEPGHDGTFVLVDPQKPVTAAKPSRGRKAKPPKVDCAHPTIKPSDIPAGETRRCPGCFEELRRDPV